MYLTPGRSSFHTDWVRQGIRGPKTIMFERFRTIVKKEEPAVSPLLLAPWGRNGSTYLMSILTSTPAIFGAREYPFEQYQTALFLRAAQVLAGATGAEPVSQAELSEGLWDGILRPVEGLPLVSEGGDRLVSELMAGMWRGWVRHLRKSGELPAGTRYYAEKATIEAVETLARSLRVYSLFIIRDPRDMLASSKEFNLGPGDERFGWSPGRQPNEMISKLIESFRVSLDRWERLPENAVRLTVRYEDLVHNEERELRRLSRRLGVRLKGPESTIIPSSHRTTASARDSIGRWKNDLPECVVEQFHREGRDLLDRLGYV